tara:strand:+ start:909 stop:1196 length:288 start_codon:yes stop_codon:yes gene_type:complete
MRRRKNNSRGTNIISRLKGILSKYAISETDKREIDGILARLEGRPGTSIESTKLNNNKQNEVAKVIYNGDNNLDNLNLEHLSSASGTYRKGRVDK